MARELASRWDRFAELVLTERGLGRDETESQRFEEAM